MNQSVDEDVYKISCRIFGRGHFFIKKLPSTTLFVSHVVVLAVSVILIFTTVLLNGVSVITITKSSQLKNKMCYFTILMQSVTDLIVGVLGIPLFFFFLLTGMGEISNCFVAILAYRSSVLPIGVSFVTLSVLTVDRYIAILHPYSYHTQVTRRRILVYLCSCVMLMLQVGILSLSIEGLIKSFTVGVATLSLTSTVFSYARIYLVVRRVTHFEEKIHVTTAARNLPEKKMFLREVKQARNCFVVVVCFFLLCFLPILLTFSVAAGVDEYELFTIQNWATTLSIFNSNMNSLIFFWTKKKLRKEALKLLKAISSFGRDRVREFSITTD